MTILGWILVIAAFGIALLAFGCLRAAGRASRAEERMDVQVGEKQFNEIWDRIVQRVREKLAKEYNDGEMLEFDRRYMNKIPEDEEKP